MATMGCSVPGEDAFDTVAWDPDLPSIKSPDESPEPVPLKPQPLAYTTVGSVVNPNSLPQLSAPNRIQREGANRRPLLSLLQGFQSNSSQRRGPAPPLNMSNSMHYAQQFGTRSANPETINPAPYQTSSRTTPAIANIGQGQGAVMIPQNSTPMLSHQERENLMIQYGAYQGIQATASSAASPLKPANLMQLSRHQQFNIKDLHDDDSRTKASNTQGPLQGLEKMQTLQRLAKFENPMQQHARNRLSEFSVARPQMSSANPLGELNRDYQFPPPGMGVQSAPQSNPLLGPADQSFSAINPLPVRPPGYPQPLTAGPPGQRQAPPPAFMRALIQRDNMVHTGGWEGSQWYNSMGAQQTNNPWAYQHIAQIPEPAPGVLVADLDKHDIYTSVKVLDTLPYTEIEKYYPRGFPDDFDGYYTPLPFDVKCLMANCEAAEDAEEERTVNQQEMQDNYFYYGQRRLWGLSVDDYMQELSMLTAARQYPHKDAPLPPRKRFTESVIPPKVLPKEMDNMSIAEAIYPLLNAAIGTMINLYDRGIGSARDYSNFGDADPVWIDSQPEATTSLFGEDWGRASKIQQGRISRSSQQSRQSRC